MNYHMMILGTTLFCVVIHLQSMNRYQGHDIFNCMKRYIFPLTIGQIEAMSFEEKNLELSCQALVAFKQFELNRTKPVLDPIVKLVRYGASADCQICVRNEHIEKIFTPLYLALVANSIKDANLLLEKGAQTDVVWSVSTIAKTDRPFCFSALQVADRWCDDSGDMKNLIRRYEIKRKREVAS